MLAYRATKHAFLASVLALGLAVGAAPAIAAPPEAAAAKRNVNLSALQGMLAQQIAKATCFASLGVHPEAQVRYVRGGLMQFTRTLDGLRHGSTGLGLAPETRRQILQGLDKVDRVVTGWAPVVGAMPDDGRISDQLLERIVVQSENVIRETQEAALRSERTYGAGDAFPLAVSLRISLAGRQRMLSQKMAKEVCLIARGFDVETNRAALVDSVALFDATQTALIEGFPAFGLDAERNPELREQLEFVRGLWREVKPVYEAVAGGAMPTEAQLADIAWQNNQILVRMNKAVFRYEGEGQG